MSIAACRLLAGLILGLLLLGAVTPVLPLPAADPSAAPNGSGLKASTSGDPRRFHATQRESLRRLETEMWERINRERTARANQAETGGHARPLKWDEHLARVARAHSQDMAARGFFSHTSPEGLSPIERLYNAGILWPSIAENIARKSDASQIGSSFIHQPPFQPNHRANILNPHFTHVGIGVVRGPDALFYITQEFAQEDR